MSLVEKFAHAIEEAQESVDYWKDVSITDFTRDLHHRMRLLNMTHADLARRMGTSRPYVTKLLEGGNFTLETMVKVAMALDGVIRVHLADRDSHTRWFDEYAGEGMIIADFGARGKRRLQLSTAEQAANG